VLEFPEVDVGSKLPRDPTERQAAGLSLHVRGRGDRGCLLVWRLGRPTSVQTASAPTPTDTVVPTEAPPPTQTAPNELSYAQALQGREGEDPSKVTPPAPAPEEPRVAARDRKPAPISTPAAAQRSDPTPPPPQASAPAVTKKPDTPPPAQVSAPPAAPKTPSGPPVGATKPGSAPNGFFVQVGAFGANDIAAKEVAKLRGKGYPAFVFTDAENAPGPRFKVRVGPYSAHAEADRTLKSLRKEGYTPLIRR
jgi:cell division protein FtsN